MLFRGRAVTIAISLAAVCWLVSAWERSKSDSSSVRSQAHSPVQENSAGGGQAPVLQFATISDSQPFEAGRESEGANRSSTFVPPIIVPERQQSQVGVTSRATSHPHGEVMCASGCALSRHPTPRLSKSRFFDLVRQYATEPADQPSKCLDELVFYGTQTAQFLSNEEHGLSQEHQDLLRREVGRVRMAVELRVVDEFGVVRVSLPSTNVPQHIRQEFAMDVHDFQPAVTSGTIKRVGLNHVWQRL